MDKEPLIFFKDGPEEIVFEVFEGHEILTVSIDNPDDGWASFDLTVKDAKDLITALTNWVKK